MFSLKAIVLVAAAFAAKAECSGIPAVAAAPLIAPAVVGYSQAIPQNIPPFASQVSVVNRAFSRIIAAPAFAAAPLAAPLAAAPPVAAAPLAAPLAGAAYTAPVAAPFAAPFAVGAPLAAPYASYVAGPAPVVPAAYSAPTAYAASYPYSAPLLRAPYRAPALVR